MPIITTREQRRLMARQSAKLPATLQEVPRHEWPAKPTESSLLKVWRSRDFLVQVHAAGQGAELRLSVIRTELQGQRWRDGITWDEMQRLKAEAGFGDRWAVEIVPPDRELVNVANVRHIWLLREAPGFAWVRTPRLVVPTHSEEACDAA